MANAKLDQNGVVVPEEEIQADGASLTSLPPTTGLSECEAEPDI